MPSPTITLSRAKLYLERGWSVLPINPENKHPLSTWKHLAEERPDTTQLMEWLAHWPDMHLGVISGSISSLLILDADRDVGVAEVEERGIPRTPTVTSPRGGRHYYLALPSGQWSNRAKLGRSKSLDVRAEHGYVVAPPSKGYKWVVGPSVRLAEPPEWLLGLLSGPGTRQAREGVPKPSEPPPPVGAWYHGDDEPPSMEAVNTLLPARIRDLINYGHDPTDRYPSRSEADAAVVRALVRAGATDEQIRDIFDAEPIGAKWREPATSGGYLKRTISRYRESPEPAQLVVVQEADFAPPPGGEGMRIYLGLKVLKGTLRGKYVRSGVTMPGRTGDCSERFEAMLAAAGLEGLKSAKVGQICDALLGKKFLVELDMERRNPVTVFRR